MESRQQALRTIALKLNVSGTAEVLDETKLYKDSYGFVKLQAYAPKTQNTQAPVCTVFCTTQNEFGVEKISSNNYNLLYVGEFALDGQAYLLFECYLPKEFTSTVTPQNGLKITLNYYDTAPTLDTLGNPVLDANGFPTRHTTALLVSSRYTTTVYSGGWNNADIELGINSAEAAQINENMRNIAELQLDVVELRNTGVDVIARQQIKDEEKRAQDEENTLREKIADEILRAEQTEKTIVEDLTSLIVDTVEVEKSRAENIEQDLQEKVADITSYIPPETSYTNQLTNKNFVNSSINNLAAFYITYNAFGDKAYPTRADLLNATTFYSGGKERVPTQNDYAIVLADESQPKGVDGSYPTTRYSYQGGTYPDGQWDFQYIVNNTSLTQAQIDAINSGITKELVDVIGKGNVLSVNGATGIVTITPANIGAVNKSGDAMTGALELPLLLGTDATDNRGIIPVRWIDRSEFGLASSDTLDKYLQAWIKKICVLYPNQQDCIFVGTGNPATRIMIQALIYDTSDIDSTGMPRYVIGMERRYGTNPAPFNVKNYIYSYGWDSFYIEKSSSALDVGVWRSDIDKRINISISSDGLKRGLWSNDHSWILYMDDNGVVYFNGADATATKQGTVYGITESSGSNKTALGYGSRISGQLYTPTNCTVIGYQAVVQDVNNTTRTNNTALGYGATITNASNTIQLGNSSISTLNCKVGVTTTSDERDKIDITVIDNGKALEFICAVDPIQYVDNDRDKYLLRETIIDEETGETVYDENGENEKIYRSYGSCEYDREAHARGDKKGDRKRIGVSAQKTQEALMSIFGSDNYANIVNDNQYDLRADGIDIPVENRLTVCYERFVPLLIGAVKAQQKQIDALEKRINNLEHKIV